MIDEMIANLTNEQVSDDLKKAYCEKSLDETDDTKKVLRLSTSTLKRQLKKRRAQLRK